MPTPITPPTARRTASLTGVLVLGLAVSTFAAGGATATPASSRSGGASGWVEGIALDRAGAPIAGALVNVLGPAEVPERGLVADRTDRRTTTAADGSFRVRQSDGGYLVQICTPDDDVPTTCRETSRGAEFAITYVGGSGTTDSWVLQQSLLPTTATSRDLGAVRVQPLGGIAGTISGAAEGHEVRVMRLNHTVAFRTWTDAQGHYELDGLVPGRYYVAAGGAGTLPWSSRPVELTADKTVRVDAALQRGAVMLGRLVADAGRIRGTEVLVTRRGHGPVASAVVDRSGRFEVAGLVPGRYVVGIPESGGPWRPHTVGVRITAAHQTVRPVVRLRRGAQLVLDLREAGRPAANVPAELRDRRGRPVLTGASDEHGRLTLRGLAPGRWTVVAAGKQHFGMNTLVASKATDRAILTLDRPLLTMRGRTAPRAVVEATTGDFCPPDRAYTYGAFHQIVRADAKGGYVIKRLVPGRYMLGADGWPRTHAPRCWSGVRIRADRTHNLPLRQGASATGRLVYAGTTQPVITPLSYELFHRPGSPVNPTEEHPARARTAGATGAFVIRRVAPGVKVSGRLATEAGEGINDESFFVTFPFQDGTPYWLDTDVRPLTMPTHGALALGDVPVTVHGR